MRRRKSRVGMGGADDDDSDDDDDDEWCSEDTFVQSMTTSVAEWDDLMLSIFGAYIAEYFPTRLLVFIVVFTAVIFLNAAAFVFVTTHGSGFQLSYLMPFFTEDAKEFVGEVMGFIPSHVKLNSAALWVACRRPDETTALSLINAAVHNACPGVISAAFTWTSMEFFASKLLSGIFEEGTFFGEVMLGIMRTSVKHAGSARDEAAADDDTSSKVSVLAHSFLFCFYLLTRFFFFSCRGVAGGFRKDFRSQAREGGAGKELQTRAHRLSGREGHVGGV